jgi:hypothetical protein
LQLLKDNGFRLALTNSPLLLKQQLINSNLTDFEQALSDKNTNQPQKPIYGRKELTVKPKNANDCRLG